MLSGMQHGLAITAPLDLSVNQLKLCRLCLTQRSHCTILYFFILFIYVFTEMRGATSMRENSHLREAIRGLWGFRHTKRNLYLSCPVPYMYTNHDYFFFPKMWPRNEIRRGRRTCFHGVGCIKTSLKSTVFAPGSRDFSCPPLLSLDEPRFCSVLDTILSPHYHSYLGNRPYLKHLHFVCLELQSPWRDLSREFPFSV